MTKRIGSLARAAASALIALIAIVAMGSGAEAASFGYVKSLSCTEHTLAGTGPTYNVAFAAPSGSATMTLKAVAADSGSGTKLHWTVTAPSSPAPAGTAKIDGNAPDQTKDLDTGGTSDATITFANIADGDKFTIKAQLVDNSNVDVGSSAVINVTFTTPIPLTGVSLSTQSLKIRANAKNQHITAMPLPAGATNVTYSWSSSDPTIAAVSPEPLSPDIALLTVTNNIGSTVITLNATGDKAGGGKDTFTASCDVEVVSEGDIDNDEVRITPLDNSSIAPSSNDKESAGLYRVDQQIIKARFSDVDLSDDIIKQYSGSNGKVLYLLGSVERPVSLDVRRSVIANALDVPGYETSVVSAMNIQSKADAGDMIPMLVSFKIPRNLRYPDRTTLVEDLDHPTTTTDAFHSRYIIKKYFASGHSIDISGLLSRNTKKSGGRYLIHDETVRTDEFMIDPLVVLVNDLAPSGSTKCHADDTFGVKYARDINTLYIYDGDPDDGVVNDPIVLERRPVSTSGGGGGGCSAGLGIAALAALAIAAKKRAR